MTELQAYFLDCAINGLFIGVWLALGYSFIEDLRRQIACSKIRKNTVLFND